MQAAWRESKGVAAPTKYRVAVLDDADRAFGGKARYDDTLTLYDGDGNLLWQYKGLNISQTVGGNHAVAYASTDRSIWVVENTGDRLLKFSADGSLLWEKSGVKGHTVAVDPKTGNGRVITEEGTIYGKNTVVFSPSGEKLASSGSVSSIVSSTSENSCTTRRSGGAPSRPSTPFAASSTRRCSDLFLPSGKKR